MPHSSDLPLSGKAIERLWRFYQYEQTHGKPASYWMEFTHIKPLLNRKVIENVYEFRDGYDRIIGQTVTEKGIALLKAIGHIK